MKGLTKNLVIILTILLVLGLAACQTRPTSEPEPAPVEQPAAPAPEQEPENVPEPEVVSEPSVSDDEPLPLVILQALNSAPTSTLEMDNGISFQTNVHDMGTVLMS